MITNPRSRVLLTGAVVILMVLATSGGARAATPPVKLVPSAHITNGFEYLESVAVAPTGNIYVTDRGHNRVQELTPAGVFVLMFGKDVNQTTGGDLCTAASGNVCKAGLAGSGPGEFSEGAQSLTVDQSTGLVYVQDLFNWRVQEFTAAGGFVLMIGKEVNSTKDQTPNAGEAEKNLCTAASGDVCKAGVQSTTESTEHGAFSFAQQFGDLLAAGGPEDLLYVGDEHRVQEFKADGTWVRDISLASVSSAPDDRVTGLAVDATGDVYLVYSNVGVTIEGHDAVREFNPGGVEVQKFTESPREPNAEISIEGLSVDASGRLAVSAHETSQKESITHFFGSLYDAATGRLVTEFSVPGPSGGIAFDDTKGSFAGYLYLAAKEGVEVVAYKPLPVAELLTVPVSCKPGLEVESSVTLDCSLNGTVNPEGVSETKAWFEWGRTPLLGERTPVREVEGSEEPKAVSAPITGVRPNETFYYRVAGEDQNVKAPEQLTSATASFLTPLVAPKIVGVPSVEFVTSASVVMFGELNPENANTTYEFQYGPCGDLDSCPGALSTASLESSSYGKLGVTLEARGLQPATLYHYRLTASNEQTLAGKPEGGSAASAQGVFMTGPAPVPQAATGPPSAVAASTATVSGTVNPDGQPATYAFEVGVYEGAQTQYGLVFSGSAGTGTSPVSEALGLTGLQPGGTYAYRIRVSSGYGTATGETVLFTTQGLPALLALAPTSGLLAIPNIAFPKAAKVTVRKATKHKRRAHRKGKAHKRKHAKHGNAKR